MQYKPVTFLSILLNMQGDDAVTFLFNEDRDKLRQIIEDIHDHIIGEWKKQFGE
jgi:hypothetical protein